MVNWDSGMYCVWHSYEQVGLMLQMCRCQSRGLMVFCERLNKVPVWLVGELLVAWKVFNCMLVFGAFVLVERSEWKKHCAARHRELISTHAKFVWLFLMFRFIVVRKWELSYQLKTLCFLVSEKDSNKSFILMQQTKKMLIMKKDKLFSPDITN